LKVSSLRRKEFKEISSLMRKDTSEGKVLCFCGETMDVVKESVEIPKEFTVFVDPTSTLLQVVSDSRSAVSLLDMDTR